MKVQKISNNLIIYTQPGCDRCEILKEWLKNEGIEFGEKAFDTEVQTEAIMMDIFDDPPFLSVNDTVVSSSELFDPNGSVIESVVRGLLIE